MMLIFILIIIIAISLFMPIGFSVYIENNHVVVKLIIFKVIKINLFDKTKVKEAKGLSQRLSRFAWRKIPLEIIMEILRKTMLIFRNFLRKMEINIYVDLKYGFSSPDKTAISYGILNSLIFSMENLLRYETKKYKGKYLVLPDLNNQLFEADIKIKVFSGLIHLIIFGTRMLKILFKYKSYF